MFGELTFEERLLKFHNYLRVRQLRKKVYKALEALEKWDRLCKEINDECKELCI